MVTTGQLKDATDFGHRPGDGPLRPGGVESDGKTTPEKDLPSTPSARAKAQAPALALVRDLAAGPERVREKGQEYLPRAPGEEAVNYQDRLKRSPFFNVFGHTIEGFVGFVFRRDPKLGDDVPPAIRAHWEDIDMAGTHGDVFLRDLLEDGLTAGHAGILVDYPRTGGAQTAYDEMGPVRPYWVPVKKDDILSWRNDTVEGREILTQLVIRETVHEADGRFGEREVTRYRVLYRDGGRVGFQLLAVTEQNAVVELEAGEYPTQEEIPFAEVTTSGRVGLLESRPPLLDLAHLNIAHYQQYSDYVTAIHKTCVPIFVTVGLPKLEPGETMVLGPNSGINIPDPQGDAKYVSHSGQALDNCKQSLDDLKSDMAALGLAMLAPQKRAAETAEAKRIDKATTDSKLAVIARGLQDGAERALGFHARYMKLSDGGSIEINRDFDMLQMPPDVMRAYVQAAKDVGFPTRLLLEEWQAGGRIAENVDLDVLELEMLAGGSAEAEAETGPEEEAA